MDTPPNDTEEARKSPETVESLSQETGVSVDMLRTLAGISDPNNEHLFTAEAARKAFAGDVRKPR